MSGPSKPRWLDWLPLIGMAITIIGIIWAGAQYVAEINDNHRRIELLETKTDTIQQIDVRTARIEAKLEIMDERRNDK